MRIGVDWGGTKIEVIAIDDDGKELLRERVATPKHDYEASVEAAANLVKEAERKTGKTGTVGFGIPGTISPATGLVKNGNSTWLNGQPLLEDMSKALNREVRIQNDANCFAVSEAVDGAGEGHAVVAAIILGTGCGCGLAFNGKAHSGRGGIGGEFGHIQLSPRKETDAPLRPCWCGREACVETYVSGPGFEKSYMQLSGDTEKKSVQEILALDNATSQLVYQTYLDRLGRSLSVLINIVDPDIIVLGGGMSNILSLYEDLPATTAPYVFTDVFDTPIVQAQHGDSSGVRGAAWLW